MRDRTLTPNPMTPRRVIDAIFAITNDPSSWNEPMHLPYASSLKKRLLGSDKVTMDDAFLVHEYFPRSLLPLLIEREIQRNQQEVSASVDALSSIAYPRVPFGSRGMGMEGFDGGMSEMGMMDDRMYEGGMEMGMTDPSKSVLPTPNTYRARYEIRLGDRTLAAVLPNRPGHADRSKARLEITCLDRSDLALLGPTDPAIAGHTSRTRAANWRHREVIRCP